LVANDTHSPSQRCSQWGGVCADAVLGMQHAAIARAKRSNKNGRPPGRDGKDAPKEGASHALCIVEGILLFFSRSFFFCVRRRG
jgi:hypothetical protein